MVAISTNRTPVRNTQGIQIDQLPQVATDILGKQMASLALFYIPSVLHRLCSC